MTTKQAPQLIDFPGFISPNTTPVPDEFFDVVAPRLKEGELRVCLYIIRRTFGFKKSSDDISLSQMVNGIRTRDGRVLDSGTGLSKPAVINAVRSLEAQRIIVTTTNRSTARGHEATTYRLNVMQPGIATSNIPAPLVNFVDKGASQRSLPALVNEDDPQQTVLQQTGINSFEFRRNLNSGQSFADSGDNSASQVVTPPRTRSPKASNAAQTLPPINVIPNDNASTADGEVESVGEVLKRGRGRPPKQPHTEERQQIHSYIKDFAPQLGDQAPLASSVTRAYNLYLASGWPIACFVDALYQARAKTRERSAGIRTALPKDDPWGTKPKMAYFFSVLEDEVGLRDEEPAVATTR